MKKLIISGSSFLSPNQKAWHALQKEYEIKFSGYGDLNILLESEPNELLALALFLPDFCSELDSTKAQSEENLLPLLGLIKIRLERALTPTVICLSKANDNQLIRSGKTLDNGTIIHFWLLNQLKLLADEYPSLYLIDLDGEFSRVGFNAVYDQRNWYFAHCRLSSLGLLITANSIQRILHRHYHPPAKALVLDCDNTLWGGVIGEDGISGITLGQDGLGKAFVDFQIEIKKLMSQGVILLIASKNNESDVWEVFDSHHSMILKREDLVAWKINWNEKAINIKQLAAELDLGLDSIVFWDDNPVERDKVRLSAPEVNTIEVSNDVCQWAKQLKYLDCFAKFRLTPDDLKKTTQYLSRSKFIRDSSKIENETEYLQSIKLIPKIHAIDQSNIDRAVQLCAKTNQFNLRTTRYDAEQLLELTIKHKAFCFLVSLSDLYGDHGIVGLVLLRPIDSSHMFIDTFLLSCRVLGRHLEAWMLNEIVIYCKKNGFKTIFGEYIETRRNIVAKNFFANHGFNPLEPLSHNKFFVNSTHESTITNKYFYSISSDHIPYMDIYEKS